MNDHLRRLLPGLTAIGLLFAGVHTALAFGAGAGDDYFAAGATVALNQIVAGDALLAGGRIDSDAAIGGDATLVGGQVAVRTTVGEDLYAAAGWVEVDALIGGDVRLAAGQVQLTPETSIAGSVAIAGGSVTVVGSIGGQLVVAAGEVTLGGDVAGDVRVRARALHVLKGTRIGGNLIYHTSTPVTLPADVQIGGGILPEESAGDSGAPVQPQADRGAGFAWIWLAGLFAVGVLFAVVFARVSRRTSRALASRPWFGMLAGFLALAATPALIIALLLTLVGIPLALILLPAYVAVLLASYVIGALFLGDRMLVFLRPAGEAGNGWRAAALLVVLLVLALVGDVPLFGWVAHFAVLLLGLGGLLLVLWEGSRRPAAA